MTNTTPAALALATITLAAGYALGRLRPLHRASDWANRQRHGQRPTGMRYAAVWTVLSIENLTWLATHPLKGWRAWQHRNDPPPPRSPAVAIRRAGADLGIDTPEYGRTGQRPSAYLKAADGEDHPA